MYKIVYKRDAEKFLKTVPPHEAKKIRVEIESLAENPRKHGVIKLESSDPAEYRTRQGNYRIVFSIDDGVLKIVTINRIFSRGAGY